MTVHRKASIVYLERQPDQSYLVADGCPHPRPDDAPFYACMCAIKVSAEGRYGWARMASCEHLASTSHRSEVGVDAGEADFLVECSFGGSTLRSEQVGLFGVPVVSHAGDSDGGDHD